MPNIDTALYRMKAYSSLLMESVEHSQKDVGQDLRTLVEWIEYARPLVGCVTPDASANQNMYATAQAANPFARHGLGLPNQSQNLGHQQMLSPAAQQKMTEVQAPYNLADPKTSPPAPKPEDEEPNAPVPADTPAPAPAPVEDKPAA